MHTVTLQSNDGLSFVTEMPVARCSGTIRTMLDALGIEGDGAVVPLPNVRGDVLELVLRWAHHHSDDLPLVDQRCNDDDTHELDETYAYETDRPARRSDNVGRWDQEFLRSVERQMLFELMRAANYLEISALLETVAKTVANIMRDKSTDEMRELYFIPKAADNGQEATAAVEETTENKEI